VNELLSFVLGSVVASYIYTTVERNIDKKNKTLFSRCNNCKKRLVCYELIPLLSYLIQFGRCRKCKNIIPIRYFLFELIFGLIFLFFYLFFNNLIEAIGLCLIFSILFYISYYDFLNQEISEVSLLLLLIIIIISLFVLDNISILNLYGSLISGGIIFLFYYLSKERAMGFGDVELALVLGFWVGSEWSLYFIFLAFILGGIYGAIVLLFKIAKLKDRVAFGPFLALSSLIIYIFCL